jgi:predicted dehydrogenase
MMAAAREMSAQRPMERPVDRPLRFIQVGVGGYGRTWLDTVSQSHAQARHVALVDVNPAALDAARATLGAPGVPAFSSLAAALNEVPADAVLCVVPPAHHEAVVVPALEAGLHVLSEKPIADTLGACHRIVRAARASRRTMMVSQKARYHPWVRRFRQVVQSGELGTLSHVTYDYKDARIGRLSWGRFRHEMADPLFVEMSVHHFDLIRALLGRDPVSVWAESWNPPWSGFRGDIVGFVRFRFEDDLPVLYRANKVSRGDLTSWYGEIVAEGEHASLSMVYPRMFVTHPGATQASPRGPQSDLMAATDPQQGQAAALAEFLGAIAGGRPPETSIDDNLTSVAMVLAAVDSAHQHRERAIADYLT